MCATERLAQRRSGVSADSQWRAPYDHLLAKDKYPQFGVDPDNLLPVCFTCNSKAKLAIDILFNSEGVRRTFFDPWSEGAHGKVKLRVDFLDISPVVCWGIMASNQEDVEKLTTWNEVYKIKERIEGEFISLHEKLSEDLDFRDLAAFKASIESKAEVKMNYARLTPFNYWRGLLYESLLLLSDQSLEQLRVLCHDGLDPHGDAAATYGI
ncbi:hypothetical protein D3C71_1550760 [compost metagenome]